MTGQQEAGRVRSQFENLIKRPLLLTAAPTLARYYKKTSPLPLERGGSVKTTSGNDAANHTLGWLLRLFFVAFFLEFVKISRRDSPVAPQLDCWELISCDPVDHGCIVYVFSFCDFLCG